jgi:opacity protein-like surface antigen
VPASSPYAAAATTAYPTASATPQQAYGQQGYAQGPASYAQVPAPTPYADPNAGAYASAYGQAPAPQYGQYQQQYQQAPAPTYQQPQAYAAPAYPSYAPASQDQYQVAAAPSYPQAAYADPSQAYAQPYGTQSTYPQAGGPYASGGVPAYGATPSADYGSAYGTSYGAQPAQTQEAPAARGTTEASYAAEPLRRGFYFGMSSGVTIPTDATYTLSGAPVTTEYKTGWQLGTAVGYSFRPWGAWVQPRLEGELAYMQNSVDSHTIGGTKSSDPTAFGTLSVFSFLANTYLDFPVTRNFVPYISGGIGVGFVDIDRHGTNGTGVYLDDDGTGFTWQGGAGAAIGIGRFLMDVGYRYQQTMDIDVKPVSGATSSVDIGSHIIRIGFRQPF